MVLPLMKLGTLALKTISKPLASQLKHQAKVHPRFRLFIVNVAQRNHRFTTQMQRRIYGHATNEEIRPLNEEKAVQAAADLIGELFVFAVGGAVVIFEVQRNARSEARKEEARKKEIEELRAKDEELEKDFTFLRNKIEELEKLAKSRGLSGIFHLKQSNTDDGKSAKPS
ncbi:PREDICTED: OPA3-like protein isoform X1 [Tarenaya hassleriana]|uniref:OPA3-like protein isoform X1 n=1 Tax=Tarenaya hassleriana TaxID=28532 RepID=UPI00053C1C31|nr:PREDICTED: OPA3-like protein isoform X1 [Tarenaya hassleriana]